MKKLVSSLGLAALLLISVSCEKNLKLNDPVQKEQTAQENSTKLGIVEQQEMYKKFEDEFFST